MTPLSDAQFIDIIRGFAVEVKRMVEESTAPLLARIMELEARPVVGVANALIDSDGVLVLTLSDGTLCRLGRVHGKDGDPGKDGKDGLGYEDLEVVQTTERDCVIRFVRGEDKKEFPLRIAGFVDRGVYKPDAQYQKGDGVTWGGCLWLAQRDTTNEKPNAGSDSWRLAVKCGRDGKDGRTLPPLPNGPVKA